MPMKKLNIVYFIVTIILVAVVSCNNEPDIVDISDNDKKQKKEDPMIEVNKEIVRIEEQFIQNYIHRHNLNTKKLSNGIRYDIYRENPRGQQAHADDFVEVSYTIKLLTGDEVEVQDSLITKRFVVSQSEDTQGLHYSVLQLREKEKGIFIVPSNLAYGITGKRGQVPHSAALVYDIELKNIIEKDEN